MCPTSVQNNTARGTAAYVLSTARPVQRAAVLTVQLGGLATLVTTRDHLHSGIWLQQARSRVPPYVPCRDARRPSYQKARAQGRKQPLPEQVPRMHEFVRSISTDSRVSLETLSLSLSLSLCGRQKERGGYLPLSRRRQREREGEKERFLCQIHYCALLQADALDRVEVRVLVELGA